MSEEEIVSQHKAASLPREKVLADDKGLSEAVGRWLHRVLDGDAPSFARAEKLLEARGVLRSRDHQNVPDSREHQDGKRGIDHGLVIDRKKLFRDSFGYWMKPRTGPARQDDALHSIFSISCAMVIFRPRTTSGHCAYLQNQLTDHQSATSMGVWASSARAILSVDPLSIFTTDYFCHPLRVVKIPLHGLADAGVKGLLW